jgi:hypothetical protein
VKKTKTKGQPKRRKEKRRTEENEKEKKAMISSRVVEEAANDMQVTGWLQKAAPARLCKVFERNLHIQRSFCHRL